MRRNVQIVLLYEDKQHGAFMRRVLKKRGWDVRRMRPVPAPGGRGSGEQFVRERFPAELQAYRSRRGQVDQALIVMVDGDRPGVTARLAALDDACKAAGIPTRQLDEAVAVFVPTWRIETWLAYLDGETVDERRGNYPRLDRERECQRHVDALVEMCDTGNLRDPAPPSLLAACDEYNQRLPR